MFKLIVAAAACVATAMGMEMKLNLGGMVNKYSYGDPKTGCKSTEQNVSVTGLPGDFCSPPCDANQNCPTDYPPGVTAQGECVLEMNGSTQPTYCALICDPSTSGDCGKIATCQPIQGTGVCTYAA